MFHIIATIVALSQPLVYAPVPSFDTKEACETYLAGDDYAAAVARLKTALEQNAIDTEVASACVEIEQPK